MRRDAVTFALVVVIVAGVAAIAVLRRPPAGPDVGALRHRIVASFEPSDARDPTKFVVLLRRGRGDAMTTVRVGDEDLGPVGEGPGHVAESEATLATLRSLLDPARSRAAAAGTDPEDLEGVVDAAPDVPAVDVIRLVDALVAGGLRHVTFVGTPPDGELSKLLAERRK